MNVHICVHTHTEALAVTLGSYFSHCFYKAYMYMNVCAHLCAHTHTHTHTRTHTESGLVPLAVTLGSYFSHCYHKVYMYMNVHICVHTHTEALACTTCRDFGFLFLTVFTKYILCMNVHTSLLCK